MASRQSYELVDLFKRLSGAIAANPNMSLGEMRAVFEHVGDASAEPRGVDYIEVDAAGVPAMWAVPKNCAEDRVVLCAHGGGYISGSMYSHRKMYAHYAKKIGCRALIVNYRLAPENRHPAPVNEMVKAYRWLLDQGITANHLAIAGDSQMRFRNLRISLRRGPSCRIIRRERVKLHLRFWRQADRLGLTREISSDLPH